MKIYHLKAVMSIVYHKFYRFSLRNLHKICHLFYFLLKNLCLISENPLLFLIIFMSNP